jgi:F420 biosynthesis protein FbiB-like protein
VKICIGDAMSDAQQVAHLLDIMRGRRSIRRYQPVPVPREAIDAMLNAAIWSPSAHNRQPWRFAVVETDAHKERLARAMGARLRADLEADGVVSEQIEADVSRSHARITSAPLVIVLCVSMVDMDTYPDAHRNQNEYIMAVQSVAMAGQNLLLTAHALGLGACWMCAPLFVPDVVRAALDLPSDWQPQGMLTIGYPAQEREKTRNPIESSVLWR